MDNDSNSQHDNEGDSFHNIFDYDDDDDDDDDKSYINNKCKNGHSNKNYRKFKNRCASLQFYHKVIPEN